MTKQRKSEKNPKPLPKPNKAKGLVTLARLTFIDDIIKKAESQPSVGSRCWVVLYSFHIVNRGFEGHL